jgi:hypothetical protein
MWRSLNLTVTSLHKKFHRLYDLRPMPYVLCLMPYAYVLTLNFFLTWYPVPSNQQPLPCFLDAPLP